MNDKECNPSAHNHVVERLNRNETRLNNHSQRIDALEQNYARFDAKMSSLIHAMEKLDKTIWWAIGLGATAIVGFFMRAIERGLFQ